MSTNLIIGILAVVAVAGSGVYVVAHPEIMASITGGSSMQDNMMEGENKSASVGNTFANIVALGQAVTCTFNHNDNAGNVSSGTVYMTGGAAQIRGDFTIKQSAGGPMEAHLVRTDGYNYIWGSFYPQGVKSKVVNNTELMSDKQNGGISDDTEFSCQAWNVDNSKFVVPTSVQFMEVNASVDASAGVNVGGAGVSGSASGSASVKTQQCAACASLPTGSKEQCLAALAC